MTHEELLHLVKSSFVVNEDNATQTGSNEHQLRAALRAVVELHRPDENNYCLECTQICYVDAIAYPCLTIQAIEKELG